MKSGEQNASHQCTSVGKESQLFIQGVVGGGEERQICVGEVVWRWLTLGDTQTHTYTHFIRNHSLLHLLSPRLLLSLTVLSGDEVMPPRLVLCPLLTRFGLLLLKAINPWRRGLGVTHGIIHKIWALTCFSKKEMKRSKIWLIEWLSHAPSGTLFQKNYVREGSLICRL